MTPKLPNTAVVERRLAHQRDLLAVMRTLPLSPSAETLRGQTDLETWRANSNRVLRMGLSSPATRIVQFLSIHSEIYSMRYAPRITIPRQER